MRWIAAAPLALLLMAGQHATAQTATVITLSCDGTTQLGNADTREPVSKIGLIINLAEQTVTGFGAVSRIDRSDAASIEFDGEGPSVYRGARFGTITVSGSIDRVTGAVTATTIHISDATKNVTLSLTYELVCKVTNRLF